MTDAEVIKTLECCKMPVGSGACNNCPLKVIRDNLHKEDTKSCTTIMMENALDLINRQQAEIEKLNVELVGMRGACESYKMHYDNAQTEIERLKKLLSGAKDCIDEIEYAMNKVGTSNDRIDEALEEWNNLVKEMTEVSENG